MERHKRVLPPNFQRIEEVEPSTEVKFEVPSSSQVDFLKISLLNVRQVHELLRSQKHILNEVQCWDLSTKLSRAALNIEHLVHFSELEREAFDLSVKNFFRITENAKRLIENCCSANWCHAAALQINNEEAFREILVETGLCYDEIYEQAREKSSFEIEDLRQSSAFSPPTATEIRKDQEKLYGRLKDLVLAKPKHWNDWLIQSRRLALQLLERLHAVLQQNNEGRGRYSDLGIEWDNFLLDFWGDSHVIRGAVFRTTWLGMPCAKKVFKYGEWNVTKYTTEATTLPTLNHPNIVKFFHCELSDDDSRECYLAMELMEMSLQDVIQEQVESGRGVPFSLPVAVDILIQIANGLCYLHDHDVAHRDLQPSNILVNQHNSPYLLDYLHVKLADFGLLKTSSGAGTSSRPGVRKTVYRAPEAFSQDGRSAKFAIKGDVYSFAVIASHILTGKKPFEGMPASQLNEAILNNMRPQLPSDCPEELGSIVRDCWARDYRKRPLLVDICCRLESVRNRLTRGDSSRFQAPFVNPPFTDYARGMCSKRSAVRQRNAVVHEDKNLAMKSDSHSTTSMPGKSKDAPQSSTGPPFVSDSHIIHKRHSDQVEKVDDSTLINELITKLSSRSTKVHRDAAKTIRYFAKVNKENRVRIAEQGGIPFLINLLRSPDKETQEHAITALMNLSLHQNNRGLIMRAGAIDDIVHVVKLGQSTEARENAAAAIQCLSYDNENKISIGNTGAIPALVELLRSGTRQGKKDAANALCNLVSFQDGNKKRALQAGLTSLLMEIVRNQSITELDDITLSILTNLSLLKEGLLDIASMEPTAMLVDFITCGSFKGKELAASLLCKLCTEDPGFIEAAFHCGAVSPLSFLLRDENSTERCKRKAKQLLNLLE
ncbi:hypothetical protein KC19_4G178900 [Ceratodon purpureus]|uniref:Protein kinase domain-containing protein n=1 Tax=Ceratodon purpureus TaxID=3225 RepID=A0A8T0I9Z3_CERPU|nr:hypothetical protein KC19_4G178900 [Ceratodon purpureus]KAG0580513.1 hypothetical protein KC19_4G178900 [Ceratodon purpureus]KAG0580514.1 hypothetical protein KC19_4G178900 [Ceratodon purpureus]KAG0580515.1 hypothetical protein KC19_4G178900 [Ceratodon purpureus]KAG0580516.1 hypothetical protein KC19_4G178900 [Ceratodon purpureus]